MAFIFGSLTCSTHCRLSHLPLLKGQPLPGSISLFPALCLACRLEVGARPRSMPNPYSSQVTNSVAGCVLCPSLHNKSHNHARMLQGPTRRSWRCKTFLPFPACCCTVGRALAICHCKDCPACPSPDCPIWNLQE